MLAGSDFRWLLDRLKPMRLRIVLGLLCVSFAGIAATIDPLMMRSLIDRALPQGDLRLAMELAGGIGLCYFGRSALYTMGSLVNFSIAQHCIRDLRIALLDQMNRLSADYHEQTPTGEKLTRIERDVDEIANLGAETANQSLRAVLFFVLNLAMMARLNLPMTLTVLPLMPLFAIIQRRFSALLKTRADEARTEVGVATSMLNEHLAAIPQIQLLGGYCVKQPKSTPLTGLGKFEVFGTTGRKVRLSVSISWIAQGPQSSSGDQQKRNQFRGPIYTDFDLSLYKSVPLHLGDAKLTAGIQAFNLLNHSPFDAPVNDISNGQFGHIIANVVTPTSILGSSLGGDSAPRQLQLTARFEF